MDDAKFGRASIEGDQAPVSMSNGAAHGLKSKKKQTKSILIGVHCSPSQVERLEKFIESLEIEEMTRPEAIRLIMNRYFKNLNGE